MTTSPETAPTRSAPLLLALAIGIMLAITIRPDLLTDKAGRADHLAATLLCWAMAAGFVRGVGFVPHLRLWRWALGPYACLIFLALALLRLFV